VNVYDVVQFAHFLGLITLFIALAIVQRGGAKLRGAGTVEEVRMWLGLLRSTRPMFPAAVVFLLASGLYLVHLQWKILAPWVMTGLVAVAIMPFIGALVIGRRFDAIDKATAGKQGAVPAEVTRLILQPGLWAAVFGLNGAAFGLLWIMTTKPGWVGSIGVVVVVAAFGVFAGSRLGRPTGAPSAPARAG
jgi:hypothetical protein